MAETSSPVPAQAVEVLRTFLDADLRKDEAVMKACLTRETLESGRFHGGPEDMTYELGEGRMEGAVAVIPVKAVANHPSESGPASMELPCIMVQEEGEWKFDLAGTMERMMGGAMEQAMGQVAEVMSEAMEGVGKAIADGLGQGVPAEAVEVLQTFLDAGTRQDEVVMKACVTRGTLESGRLHAGPPDVTYTVGEGVMEEGVAIIPVVGVANQPPESGPSSMELKCLVVREDGEWKLDLLGTMERMRGGAAG